MRRGDDPDYIGDEGDKLWLGARNQKKFTSAHTYPAYDREGAMVFIKTVPLHFKDSQEYDWRMFDSPEARLHPDNHTVPVKKVLFFKMNSAWLELNLSLPPPVSSLLWTDSTQ
ncbi:hypothetical protein FRC00_012630 [Tulasnella sp. 408]|nr:hypothetical protein FRC00_012630 [Tulasnella sp. 408]